jgi:putative transposase
MRATHDTSQFHVEVKHHCSAPKRYTWEIRAAHGLPVEESRDQSASWEAEGKIGFHGGKVTVDRPRVRSFDGHEVALPSWTAAQAEDWLGRWAMNLMLINVSTRKLRRAVRLPEGDLPIMAGDGASKSAASRRFVALSAERLAEWMGVRPVPARPADHPWPVYWQRPGTGRRARHRWQRRLASAQPGRGRDRKYHCVQALIDNLIERGLNPKVCRLFIIDGTKALSKVIMPHSISHSDACFRLFNKNWGIPQSFSKVHSRSSAAR